MHVRIALALLFGAVLPASAAEPPPRCVRGSGSSPGIFAADRIHAGFVEQFSVAPEALAAIRDLGANTVVIHGLPDPETARQARVNGLFYVAWMSTEDLARSETDAEFRAALEAVRPLDGLYYEDDSATEGYATPDVQRRAYEQARRLFPCAMILHPTRLDPIATDPGFLDRVYRPEYTDLVTPYFYPVGPTTLGSFEEADAWRQRLASLLAEVAGRTPPEKGVLPVLQGFDRAGYPVSESFVSDQAAVYSAIWPGNRNAAVVAWQLREESLLGFGLRPAIAAGILDLFARWSAPSRLPRLLPVRP